MHETGLGIRLETYAHAPEELTRALDDVLTRGERLEPIARRLQQSRGTQRAAELIEACASR
jgi:UDP:flavonoid glycosyltransferase YjiC (YdhE family)